MEGSGGEEEGELEEMVEEEGLEEEGIEEEEGRKYSGRAEGRMGVMVWVRERVEKVFAWWLGRCEPLTDPLLSPPLLHPTSSLPLLPHNSTLPSPARLFLRMRPGAWRGEVMGTEDGAESFLPSAGVEGEVVRVGRSLTTLLRGGVGEEV